MALFDPPKDGDYPKQWKDMSLEFKLMFVYHGCMMVLFITGGVFSLRQELVFTSVLLFVLTSISIRQRRFDGSFPVRRDSSVPTLESKIFALVPSRIWHWVL